MRRPARTALCHLSTGPVDGFLESWEPGGLPFATPSTCLGKVVEGVNTMFVRDVGAELDGDDDAIGLANRDDDAWTEQVRLTSAGVSSSTTKRLAKDVCSVVISRSACESHFRVHQVKSSFVPLVEGDVCGHLVGVCGECAH